MGVRERERERERERSEKRRVRRNKWRENESIASYQSIIEPGPNHTSIKILYMQIIAVCQDNDMKYVKEQVSKRLASHHRDTQSHHHGGIILTFDPAQSHCWAVSKIAC